MNPRSFVLGFSLAANVGLLALLLWPASDASAPAQPADAKPAHAATAGAAAAVTAGSSTFSAADAIAGSANSPFATEDLPQLVARLRAAGFPEKFVRKVIGSEGQRRANARRAEVIGKSETDYWKASASNDPDPQVRARLREIDREERDSMVQLLGGGSALAEFASEEGGIWWESQFGNLPADKSARIFKLQNDYNDLRRPILESTASGPTPEDRAKLALIDRELRDDLAKILTPEEFQEYELRATPTSFVLRTQLTGFNATEAEYRALFSLLRPIADRFPMQMYSGPEQFAARRAAEEALDGQIEAALGPARFADYKLATDPAHSQINQLLARLELPLTVAPQVVAVQRDIQQRAAITRNNRTLPAAERDAQLAALAQEAETKLTGALGRRGFAGYQQSFGGNWLQNILPRPAAATAK